MGVGDDEAGRRDPAAPLLDAVARLPGHLHDRRAHAFVDGRRQSTFAGGVPGFGGDWSVPSADGYGASEIARPHAAKRDGWLGAQRWIAATIAELRAMRAGQPFAVASDGMTIQSNTSTPNAPTAAPAARSQRGRDRCEGRRRCTSAPRTSPSVWPSVATRNRKSTATDARFSARLPPNAVTMRGTKGTPIASPTATPAHASTRAREAEAPTPDPGADAEHEHDEIERVQRGLALRCPREQTGVREETRVRDHPVVGPDRLPLDVPAALQHLDGLDHAERRVRDLFAQPADLEDRRQVRQENAAGPQRVERVLHDAPRLGEIEHDPIEIAFVDALVDVAHLDVERDVVAEEAVHVRDRRAARSRRGSRSR